ncbi:hypothetical protein J1605_008027 [Eschrichtius robustus]|uniref:Transporter n=1 Tax=Eschrichtius robustus TaxID=9764 RepID=A0AB34GW34_ESCRO|nr:hypothetical protein J1605_008027 [Eschrichtius robustus]
MPKNSKVTQREHSSEHVTESVADLLALEEPVDYKQSILNVAGEAGGKQKVAEGELDVEDRPAWNSKLQYILAQIGFSVGLGNIWRFPYLCQKNGGGAYLVPYLVLLIIIGIPLFFLELAVGQRIRRGSIGVWHYVCPRLGGIGFSSCIVSRGLVAGTSQEAEGLLLGTGFTDQSPGQGLCVGRRVGMELPVASVTPMDPRLQVCLFVGLYYNVIIGWSIFYFFKSFQYPLPWMVEPECEKSSATTYFWYREALDISNSISESGGLNWKMTLCLLVAWSIVGMAVVKGIQSSGKVMYFSSLFPYVVLACFLVRGLLLRGAVDGILHMFTPKVRVSGSAEAVVAGAGGEKDRTCGHGTSGEPDQEGPVGQLFFFSVVKVTLLLGSRNQVPQCHLVSAGPSVLRSKGGVRSCHAPARARAQQLLADSKSIFMLLSQMLWNTLLPA